MTSLSFVLALTLQASPAPAPTPQQSPDVTVPDEVDVSPPPTADVPSEAKSGTTDAANIAVAPTGGVDSEEGEAPLPSYPLGRLDLPDLAAAGKPFRLVDLHFDLVDDQGTTQAFGARLRVGPWGYLGVESKGEHREVNLSTRRIDAFAGATNDLYDFGASFRAPWFVASGETWKYREGGGEGWMFRPALSVRLTPDLELLGFVLGDGSKPNDRWLRTGEFGLLWQRGTRLEASLRYAREYETTVDGFEKSSDVGRMAAVAQLGTRIELSVDGFLRDTESRFPYREWGGTATAHLAVLPRLLAEGGISSVVEEGLGQRSHAYSGGLTWYARRHTMPMAGQAARRSLNLAKKATSLGYNERRLAGDDERREQRMRLSLMAREEELRDDMEALYRAQVAERDVPILGVSFVDDADEVAGTLSDRVRAFLGVPWPPKWPWRENPGAVPFLRFDFERERRRSGLSFYSNAYRLSASAALNREMDIVVGWTKAQPTALDVIHGIGEQTTFQLSYVYAFGM